MLLADAQERKAVDQSRLDKTGIEILARPCTAQQLKDVLQVAAWSSSVATEDTGEVEHVVMETAHDQPAITESTGELHTTISGLPLAPVYTPETTPIDYERELGMPGEFPFTRGVYPTMYRCRLWTMRQFAGFGTAEETNERFHYLLEHGQTGLSTAFDMPTLMGYDSDHPRSLGEVGR